MNYHQLNSHSISHQLLKKSNPKDECIRLTSTNVLRIFHYLPTIICLVGNLSSMSQDIFEEIYVVHMTCDN
ncbi:CLUMA_CG018425, isoform A [Clunio marinus]|uniref:CLUMA_CG018425, isoform A n=1 Tax=Clunio marinus TaxID=568069 RepID=A0A1J1IYD4_9DIPT|nr:CLUMA_CG018425, isoform A [Clunio marinus]